ncbi:translation initiation factor IF-2-like [Panicum virgatum]|uniref:translation initiation factor IF-2-like n=1 Tax=Panicum virgatum TaxID=38727 RepID=UPI0019D50801|nr:translation initiation factor IF-2-like [Panicum virgatum]
MALDRWLQRVEADGDVLSPRVARPSAARAPRSNPTKSVTSSSSRRDPERRLPIPAPASASPAAGASGSAASAPAAPSALTRAASPSAGRRAPRTERLPAFVSAEVTADGGGEQEGEREKGGGGLRHRLAGGPLPPQIRPRSASSRPAEFTGEQIRRGRGWPSSRPAKPPMLLLRCPPALLAASALPPPPPRRSGAGRLPLHAPASAARRHQRAAMPFACSGRRGHPCPHCQDPQLRRPALDRRRWSDLVGPAPQLRRPALDRRRWPDLVGPAPLCHSHLFFFLIRPWEKFFLGLDCLSSF